MNKILLILTFCVGLSGFAQIKTYEKALKSFEEGNLKTANKLIDKCLLNAETKNNANVLLLKSKIMFAVASDGSLIEKFPSAVKDALKFAEKAINANSIEGVNTAFKNKNIAYLRLLVKQSNKEALEAYNQKKYAKALPLFKRSMAFELDTQSIVLAADCYWELGQKYESIPLFKKSAEMIYAAAIDSNYKLYGYHKEPFRKLGQYFIDKKEYDSAYVIVKNGREILPNDAILNTYTYELMRYVLDKIPPSLDYLIAVQNGLKDFPSDSFLNHRENSIYIYLLNGYAISNDQVGFDSMIGIYSESKLVKAKLKQLEVIKRYDIFAGMYKMDFIEKLAAYFNDIGLREACYSAHICIFNLNNQLRRPALLIQKYLSDIQSPKLAEVLFTRHIQLYPTDKLAIKTRADYTVSKNKSDVLYFDLIPMIKLNDASNKDFPKNTEFKIASLKTRLRYIDEAADSGNFSMARSIWHETALKYADPVNAKTLKILWRKMVENDFRMNYFGSRINAKGRNEKGVPEYAWNGVVDSCIAGKMSMEIVLRAEQRINYFRRMAGLTEEIILGNQDNAYCMIAVMMCEANKSLSHEPNDAWRCFIPAGLDALKGSILSKDGNPAIAVTAAMGQNHATVGNRRWLLYPYAEYMGIGTSRSYTAIKAIDNSRVLDSSKYKTQFVAWPPASDCPKMLLFKKWSFSMDRKMEGTIVTMKDGKGQAVVLKQELAINGYGLNTLVWEPEIQASSLTDNSIFNVHIKFADGKTISYQVNIIEILLQ